MFTEKQTREIVFLINQLSADLLVDHNLIVEAIKDDDSIKDSLLQWLQGSVTYNSLIDQFAEVF